jgi:hypothetical protein
MNRCSGLLGPLVVGETSDDAERRSLRNWPRPSTTNLFDARKISEFEVCASKQERKEGTIDEDWKMEARYVGVRRLERPQQEGARRDRNAEAA